MIKIEAPQARFEFWLRWTFFSAAGWLLGSLFGFLGLGAGLGLAQWWALRRQVERAELWILICSLAVLLGIILAAPIQEQDLRIGQSMDLDILFYGPAFGAIVGAVEWFFIRSWFRRPYLWILVNILGWGSGLFLGDVAASTIQALPQFLTWGLTSGGLAGAATGIGLLWLFEEPRQGLTPENE